MDRKGFGDDQPARAMQDLRTRLHSLSCDGMGKKRRATTLFRYVRATQESTLGG
jgi:hypothetical protein